MLNKKSLPFIYMITVILSMCSILYELLIAQTIVSLTMNMVVIYSLTIGLYLISMGGGAFYFYKFLNNKNHWKSLFYTEILLAIFGCFSVVAIYTGHMFWGFFKAHFHLLPGYFIFWGIAISIILLIGFLTGIEVPLLLDIGKENSQALRANRILASDYFGSLVGGVIFPLWLLPHFELIEIALIVGFMNFLVACFIIFLSKEKIRVLSRLFLLGIFLFFIVSFFCAGSLQQFFLKKYYYADASNGFLSLFRADKDAPAVQHYKTSYQDIDIVSVSPMPSPYRELLRFYSRKYKWHPDWPENIVLYMDRLFQFWAGFEELYHEYFAHIPVILNNKIPQDVLVLGAGDGLLIRELLRYPQIKNITHVDIDHKIIELAQQHPLIKILNQNALRDSRVMSIVADAYPFLRHNQKKYDAIYMDFPIPFDYSFSKLYSREFYCFVLRSLKEDGNAVLDAPYMHDMKTVKQEDAKDYFYTLKAAGFETIFTFSSRLEDDNPQAQDLMLKAIGTRDRLTIVEQFDNFDFQEKEIIGRENIMRKFLSDFVNDYKEKFIFLKKQKGSINKEYQNFVEGLFILNKERFYGAIGEPQIKDTPIEGFAVNSIFQPTLPRISYWWRVKRPY